MQTGEAGRQSDIQPPSGPCGATRLIATAVACSSSSLYGAHPSNANSSEQAR